MTDEQKTILQDLIDDVEDYATSREFKPRETEWRRELLLKARALLAAPLANPSVENTYRNALDEIVKNDPYNQSSAGVIARRALTPPSRKQEAMKAHAIDCGYIQSDNPWSKCTCGFGGPNDAAPLAPPSDKQEAVCEHEWEAMTEPHKECVKCGDVRRDWTPGPIVMHYAASATTPSDKQEADGVAVTASGAEYHNPRKAYAEAEEAGCVRMWLDDLGAPIGDDAGTFSLVGRIRAHFAPPSDKQEAVAEVGEDAVFFLRKQPDGSRWPRGTKLYAAPLAQSAEQERIDAELFQRLLHARSELGRTIANPLWADHSEVTKAALKRWHGTIDEVIKGASK